MANAAQKALGIVELLEEVLGGLDIRTLLHAQRVCKQWREVIAGSKQLRQQLRFETQDPPVQVARWQVLANNGAIIHLNPLAFIIPDTVARGTIQSSEFEKWQFQRASHWHMQVSNPGARRVELSYMIVSPNGIGDSVLPARYADSHVVEKKDGTVTIGDLVKALVTMGRWSADDSCAQTRIRVARLSIHAKGEDWIHA